MFDYDFSQVNIVEVGPRDGLQNEKINIETSDKLQFIKMLADSGLRKIEATSFVSPKAIPQMGDAKDLFPKLKEIDVNLPVLVPNMKGYELAKNCGVKEIAFFSATSSKFTKKNINATVEESFIKMSEVAQEAKKDGILMRGYVSTAFGCPYGGDSSIKTLIDVIGHFCDLGVYEVSIGDTIGVGTPKQVDQYLYEVMKSFEPGGIALHMHDTRGMALSNILVGLEHGIRTFDSSAGGLGGCPYAKGATGNVATEEVVLLMNSLGLETGVDIGRLVAASTFILGKLGKNSTSKYYNAFKGTGY